MMSRDIQNFQGPGSETFPTSSRDTLVTAIGEPNWYVRNTRGIEALGGTKEDERGTSSSCRSRVVIAKHTCVHGKLGLDKATEIGAGTASIEVDDGVDEDIRKRDMIDRTGRINEKNALCLDAHLRELKGCFVRCYTAKGPT
jgi:hypothetical protein